MLLFGATFLTGTVLIGGMIPYLSESFAKFIFLSNSLTLMMVYEWSKQNPFIHMSFLGLFTFTAAYLPWFMGKKIYINAEIDEVRGEWTMYVSKCFIDVKASMMEEICIKRLLNDMILLLNFLY
ncbi:derlin-2.2-like [Pistacia vera]|uniref:derlin-2.2-like n=1 Tax=Pistacia vera TaxID=55513 RepID=UPI001262B28F|nr:derlin-2.2-like [Pistacia vera]